MRTTLPIPQADGGDRPPVTPCDRCPAPATMFVSDRHFGGFRCDTHGADEIAIRQGSPSLAWVRITRKAAA